MSAGFNTYVEITWNWILKFSFRDWWWRQVDWNVVSLNQVIHLLTFQNKTLHQQKVIMTRQDKGAKNKWCFHSSSAGRHSRLTIHSCLLLRLWSQPHCTSLGWYGSRWEKPAYCWTECVMCCTVANWCLPCLSPSAACSHCFHGNAAWPCIF